MTSDPEASPPWLDALFKIPVEFRAGNLSIRQLFENAAPDVADPLFATHVRTRLSREPALVHAWQQYSYDKRSSPSPYLDGAEVGFVEVADGLPMSGDVRRYDDPLDACVDFIYRETVWVLDGRRVAGTEKLGQAR
jgi:hypothetical protein